MVVVGLTVEEGDGVHDLVVEPHEDAEGDLTLVAGIEQALSVSEDLGGETSETKLGQDGREVRGLRKSS